MSRQLAPRELLDLHEWVGSCAHSMKKARTFLPEIRDPELRRLAEDGKTSCERAIGEAQQILTGQ